MALSVLITVHYSAHGGLHARMEVSNLTIVWHDGSEPVYSVHFQPSKENGGSSDRLVTGGGDNNVRVWRLNRTKGEVEVEYLSTLGRHTQAVNVVRFDPKGEILATAGDDGTVLIWTLSETIVKEFGQEEDEDIQESWTLRHSCRSSTSEIYDLAWSPDSKFIITGSTDNVSRIYDVNTGQQVYQIAEHNHYVQGVAWDPLGQFVATQSADRSIHIYSLNSGNETSNSTPVSLKVHHKISRAELPTKSAGPLSSSTSATSDSSKEQTAMNEQDTFEEPTTTVISISSPKSVRSPRAVSPLPAIRSSNSQLLNFNSMKNSMLYHTENLESFFRRLSFSPDGSFLFTPSGLFKNTHNNNDSKEELTNTVYIYSRSGFNKPPIAHLPGFKKPALVVSFSPIFYELDPKTTENNSTVFKLPYKMIYAVATQDSVHIYDTQHEVALGTISSIHYRILTDISWNSDGGSLIVSSADGFCTLISFKDGELGKKLDVDFKTLLPNSMNEASEMASPQASSVKKRHITTLVGNPVKKGKVDTLGLVSKAPVNVLVPKRQETKSKAKDEKTETIKVIDVDDTDSNTSDEVTVLEYPKQGSDEVKITRAAPPPPNESENRVPST